MNIPVSSPDPDAPIAASIVEQASRWLMLSWDGGLDARQRIEFDNWLAADAEHRRAWQRLQQLQTTLVRVPAQTARQVLGDQPDKARRRAVQQLGLLLVAGGGLYAAQSRWPWREVIADQRTGSGDIRHLQLSDGTQLAINSCSAVDVRFTDRERRIRLWTGEVLVTSGHDATQRPLLVETESGEVLALGTRFAVREIDGGTRVDLYEGALVVTARRRDRVQLQAGDGLWFSADAVGDMQAADINVIAWEQGRLVAERQPLGEFLRELERHRPGMIRCDEAAAGLPITGVYPLADTDRILTALQQSLPIRIRYRTRFWVEVGVDFAQPPGFDSRPAAPAAP